MTVHLVQEVMNSLEVEAEAQSVSTLSGFPVADKRRSWESFKIFNQDLPVTELSLLSTYPDLINLIISVEDTGVGIPDRKSVV